MLRRARFAVILVALVTGAPATGAADVPASTVLHIRLRQLVSSFGSRPDTRISATLIAPVEIDGKTLLPLGSELLGHVEAVRRVGLGLSRETAFVELSFDRVRLNRAAGGDGRELPLNARVAAVDNARETVDAGGRIHGIRATASFASMLSGLAVSAGAVDPMLLGFTSTSSLGVFRIPESEVVLPAGTELTVRLVDPLAVTADAHVPVAPAIDGAGDAGSELATFVRGLPFRTATDKTNIPSDITNLLFLGSRDAVSRAFEAAGWGPTDPLSARSSYAALRAIVENQGYREAPMSVLRLGGRVPVFTFAKTLDTFFKRHHARVFGDVGRFNGLDAWTSSSTHDSGIGFATRARSFIHVIDENIDEERDKIVYDMVLTGCVAGVSYVPRPWLPSDARNATGDALRTDTRIAVVQLTACEAPLRADAESSAGAPVRAVPGKVERTFRNTALWVKNDVFRGNVIYQSYAGVRMGIRALARKREPVVERSVHYGGEEFKIVPGAAASKHPLAPDDPGEQPPTFQAVVDQQRQRVAPLLEFSLSAGDTGFGNDQFSTQRLDFISNQPPPALPSISIDATTALRARTGFGVRTTFNSGRWASHEVGFGFSHATFDATFGEDGDGAMTAPAWIRQFSYNVLVHARGTKARIRPYAAVGPALQLIRISDDARASGRSIRVPFKTGRLIAGTWDLGATPPLEGGGILQAAFQYGGGVKYYATRGLVLRADFRETIAGQPDFWTKSYDSIRNDRTIGPFEPGPLTFHGPLQHRQLSLGVGIAF
jgi:LssY-like putative type I secretion system component LssY